MTMTSNLILSSRLFHVKHVKVCLLWVSLAGERLALLKTSWPGLSRPSTRWSHAPVTKALFRTSPPPAETISDASLKRRGVDGRAEPGHDGEA
jgi:hypothetical protein